MLNVHIIIYVFCDCIVVDFFYVNKHYSNILCHVYNMYVCISITLFLYCVVYIKVTI